MSQLPPSPGHPIPYPPPRPRGTRSKKGIWTGVVLMVLAPIVLALGVWWSLSYMLQEDAVITADGQPHQVSMPSGEKRGLYFEHDPTFDAPVRSECQATYADGSTVTFTPSTVQYNINQWQLASTFDSGEGQATFTCQPPAGGEPVEARIGSAPNFGIYLGAMFGSMGVAAILGLAGLIVLILSVIRRPRGAR